MNFINVDLSAFYLDFAKDVVYIEGAKSLERRQMQTVFYDILVKITKLLTPILPHTAEEIWSYLEFEAEDFVQLSELPEAEHLRTKKKSWILGQPSWTSVVKLKSLGRSS